MPLIIIVKILKAIVWAWVRNAEKRRQKEERYARWRAENEKRRIV